MESEKQWFENMAREYKDIIYTVCYMFSHDENEVADLFQEALINLWRGLPKFKEESNLKGWIYRVTLNTCISLDRKKRKRKTEALSMNVSLFDSADKKVHQSNLLHKRIVRLQPFDRAIVLLWLEDISYEEIGKILGISTKNVSVRLFRIREILKKMSDC